MTKHWIVALLLAQPVLHSASSSDKDIAEQLVDLLSQPQTRPEYRVVHAKGLVCTGTFTATKEAASLSRAAHFTGSATPVTVRFSNDGPDPFGPDNSPDAAVRGMAIRFETGRGTDLVSNSHNGFLVGTGEDFLALLKAKAATDPSKAHPWPIEEFLSAHPRALKFVQDPKPVPVSFATQDFFSNNAFRFVNAAGKKQVGRYQIIPVIGTQYLDDGAAKAAPSDYLREELKARLDAAPVKFRLMLQLPESGDRTDDASIVWPEDRKKIELGSITITGVVPDSAAAEKSLAFDPMRLTGGIELSDDVMPALRARAYAIAVARRRAH